MKKKGLVLPVLISCCLLAGCGASNSTDAYARESIASDSATASAEESWYDYEDYAEVDVAMESASDSTTVTFAQNKKIIYTSNVVLETKTYNDTYDRLIQLINDNGGYIEYENFSNEKRSYLANNDGSGVVIIATNNLTIRIPSKNYSNFMQEGLTLGNVLHRNQTVEDKTNEYNTNKSYVDILNDEVEYLDKQLDVLEDELKEAQANDAHYDAIIKDMKDIASRKAEVEKELVPYKSVMDSIDEKVEYSTITMELREVDKFTVVEPEEEEEETFLSQLKNTWNSSMERLGNMFKGTLLFLINILPALIYLTIFGAVVVGIIKLFKKVFKSNKPKKPVAHGYAPQAPIANAPQAPIANAGQTPNANAPQAPQNKENK